jgi:hypothetical protein
MAVYPALKGKPQVVRASVKNGKTVDGEYVGVDDLSFLRRHELYGNWRFPLAPEPSEHSGNNVESARTRINSHNFRAFSQPEGREKPWNAEYVVEMTMR